MPATTKVQGIASGDRLDVRTILDVLRADGHRTILTEGGPQLFGEMVASQQVDELFLTVSPNLVGHENDRSFGIMHGFDHHLRWTNLLSVRRHESHLFLRYALKQQNPSPLRGGSGGGDPTISPSPLWGG
jgi:riboflavin biosynthesis pyrimidine reductase